MKEKINRLVNSAIFRNFLMYTGGAMLLRGVGFFLIPVYTRYLVPAEFGKLELLNTFTSTLEIIFSFGLYQVLVMEFFKKDEAGKKQLVDRVLSTYLAITTFLYLITGAVIAMIHPKVQADLPSGLVYLAMVTSYFNFYQNSFITIIRLYEKAKWLTILQVGLGITSILLNILMVVVLKTGIVGILLTNLITLTVTNLLALRSYRKFYGRFTGYFSVSHFRQMLSLGMMFVPGFIAFWLMNSVSRWMLAAYSGLEAVGIFSIAVKFSSMIDPLLVQPFLNAYNPRTLKGFSEGNFNQRLGFYVPLIVLLFFALGFMLKIIAQFMVDASYLPGTDMIPLLVLSVAFGLIANVSNLILIYHRKIHLGFISVISGLAVSVTANYFLVGSYGGWGAAWATVLGNFFWMMMIYIFHRRELTLVVKNNINSQTSA